MGDIRPVYLEEKLKEVEDSGRLGYRSKALPTWCPGCGYFAIVDAVAAALCEQCVPYEDAVVVSGIGCSSRFPFFMNTYGMHTLHGRALPVATGVKTANPALTVVAVGGDGDGFAIGGGHVPHAARRNLNITYLLFDNGIYGLTKGQTSPTSATGFRTTTSPYDNTDRPINPLMLLLSYGASWVGQSYAGKPEHLRRMVAAALAHRGFSYLHIISPCVTFDKTHRTYVNLGTKIRDLPADHDPTDKLGALREAMNDATPAIGLYYREERPTLDDALDTIVERAGGTAARERVTQKQAGRKTRG
ncbi:MAG: 2-oxoacid:ferredoxin oxidoreductase subunit beta [Rhodocyclaceae bacterium]|nr:2-oxoacid:ferredoxin oxidoreductase subunit beta [Rhodocyclaceae bacterium]